MSDVKKELTYQDFLGTKHVYDHTKKSVWEAIGASEDDFRLLKKRIEGAFERHADKGSMSQAIEECLEIDMPAPWKAVGFMKMGEELFKRQFAQIVASAPDKLPLPIVKMTLLLALGLIPKTQIGE